MLTSPLVSSISRIGRELGRLVLVSPCVVCGEDLPWADRVASSCRRCWLSLPEIASSRCIVCSFVRAGDSSDVGPFTCGECARDRPACEWIESWGEYRAGLESVLQAFKFGRHDFLAEPLGDLLVEAFRRREDESFDCVTAVPLHPRKLRERGYNQAGLLARRLSSVTGLTFRPGILRRTAAGRPQSTLPRGERLRNVRRAFAADARAAAGRSILLIDDVCTTGSTLEACARTLLSAGAERVCAVVVARA